MPVMFNQFMSVPVWIYIVCCVMTIVCMPLVLWYAKKMALVDVQNSRSSHSGIALRGGGLLFILTFYLGMILLSILYKNTNLNLPNDIVYLCFGGCVIAILSWFDDYKKLSSGLRFVIHLMVVGLLINRLSFIDFHSLVFAFLPIWLIKILFVCAWVWFINLYNFMDGADGLACQEGIFIVLMLTIPFVIYVPYLLILCIGLMGFLYINYPKAKIFMGDIGSTFLGFLFAGMLILNIIDNKLDIFMAIAITSYFTYDATYTLLKRIVQKKQIWQAHREHWYQRLLIANFSHQQLFWIACIYNLGLLGMIYLYKSHSSIVLGFSIIWFALYAGFIKSVERKKQKISG